MQYRSDEFIELYKCHVKGNLDKKNRES